MRTYSCHQHNPWILCICPYTQICVVLILHQRKFSVQQRLLQKATTVQCRVVELIHGYIYKTNFTTKGSKNIAEEGPEILEELESQGVCRHIVYPHNFKTWTPKVSLIWLLKHDLSKRNNNGHDKVDRRQDSVRPYLTRRTVQTLRNVVDGRKRLNKTRVHQFVSQCQMVTDLNMQTLQRENPASPPPLRVCACACVCAHMHTHFV